VRAARVARRLAVRLYWMWRQEWDCEQWKKFGSFNVGNDTPGIALAVGNWPDKLTPALGNLSD